MMGLYRLEYAMSGGMQIPSVNNNNGVHMIGHDHIPVDDHVGVVDRNGLHFDFSNDARIRENDFSMTECAREYSLSLVQKVTKYQPREE